MKTETVSTTSRNLSYSRFCYFALNFHPNFIERAFLAERGYNMCEHLEKKFSNVYKRVGAEAAMVIFYSELDNKNRELLDNYIDRLIEHF